VGPRRWRLAPGRPPTAAPLMEWKVGSGGKAAWEAGIFGTKENGGRLRRIVDDGGTWDTRTGRLTRGAKTEAVTAFPPIGRMAGPGGKAAWVAGSTGTMENGEKGTWLIRVYLAFA